MRNAFFILALLCISCGAQMLPGAKALPGYMSDSVGKPLLMDFGIPLRGVKDSNMPFSTFSHRPVMIYYFRPDCPHCQRSYGGIQRMAKEYESKGLTAIAVSAGGGKRDVLMFMEIQNAAIPFFQDNGDFGKGTCQGCS